MLALAAAVLLALPHQGILDPGRSLAGVRLGVGGPGAAGVGTAGRRLPGCPRRTLYFTYAPFNAVGVGAEFVRGGAVGSTRSGARRLADARRGAVGTDELTLTSTYECRVSLAGYYDALGAAAGPP